MSSSGTFGRVYVQRCGGTGAIFGCDLPKNSKVLLDGNQIT